MSAVQPSPRVPFEALSIPDSVESWLAQLQDLTLLHVGGRDPSRLRIVSTLLHGNEPSSIRAAHRFLRGDAAPATDVWLLVGAVRAALGPPLFGRRFLPAHGDLNRAWLPPFEGERGARVAGLLELFRSSGAEALLDVHNNTGHNPPYGVGPETSPLALQLASLFGSLFVHTPIRLGTLMETAALSVPCVAVECGRAGDPAADAVAHVGLCEFLCLDDLASLAGRESNVRVLHDPVRVTLSPGATLCFERSARDDCQLTLDPNLDRHNFQLLPLGETLGWTRSDPPPLHAEGVDGCDRTEELFRVHDGKLHVATPFMPVMMTTSPSAAREDCLFYAVRPRDR